MPAPNKGGPKPPSILAAPPAAPVEPVSPAVAAEPAAEPSEPTTGNVAPAQGSFVLADAAATFARLAAQPEPAPPESQAPAPAVMPSAFVAVYPICTAKGRVEPGQPYKPTGDAERDLFLAQGVIRPA